MDAASKTLIGVFTDPSLPENALLLIAVRIFVCVLLISSVTIIFHS